MLLAGGAGSRLNILASQRAKPAVPFGGAYRIIDFALSNVMHAGLERVGLCTQYKPFSLTDHVKNGEPWDLVGRDRGVRVLPPHTGEADSDWYKGTADAVYQNLWFMEDHRPAKVLILSGDHIYKMDYEAMIRAHERAGAALTLAALPVPWEETHRFGVMIADAEGWVTGFEEKKRDASSNLASMGVYVFDYAVLLDELRSIVGTKTGFDFGKDIIPSMLGRRRLLCHRFEGYWRDVGTIKSYIEANLDCLDPSSGLDLSSWQVCTNAESVGQGDRPPVFVGSGARLGNCLVARGCRIEGEIENSVLFPGVRVAAGASVRDSVVMHDTSIGRGARIRHAVLDKQVQVGEGCVIGEGDATVVNRLSPTHLDCGSTVLGKGARVPAGVSVGRNCIVHPGVDLERLASRRLEDGETAAP